MNKSRALVSGATGFVGRHLVRHLMDAGWMVDAIVRPSSDTAPISDLQVDARIHVHDGSIESMTDIVGQVVPDVVFHLASLFVSEHRPEHVEPLVSSNVLFGVQLLEAMHSAGVTRLVNTGTAWQHYNNDAYNPVNLYAATKQAFEDLLRYYVEAHGYSSITLKLFDTYGPGDPRRKLLSLLWRAQETGEALAMSPGEQTIDLLHVEDAARAYVSAGLLVRDSEPGTHERYLLSSGQRYKLRELVAIAEKAWGCRLHIDWGGRPYREREVMEPAKSDRGLPGWRPVIGLEEGLSDLSGDH